MSTTEDSYRAMLNSFRASDLKQLLQAFCKNVKGRKSELKERALELFRDKPVGLDYQLYEAKILEIYWNMPWNVQKQQRMSTSMQQSRPLKLEQKPLQYLQRSIHSPQVLLPQTKKGIIRNSISKNNNMQYTCKKVGSHFVVAPALSNQKVNAVAAVHLKPRDKINTTFFFPTAQFLDSVEKKKLPFYENIAEIIKLSTLVGHNKCSIQKVHEGMREAEFRFILSAEHTNYISLNRDISNGKNEYLYQIQIRSYAIMPDSTEITDYFPLELLVRINNTFCLITPTTNIRPGTEARQTARPIDCTQFVKLNPVLPNIINVNWTPDAKTYAIGVYLVKKLTPEKLLQKLIDKKPRSSEETKNYIIRKLANVDPDLTTTSYRFSLVCPLGKMKMKIPAKSASCEHLQCFDAETFILMNEKKSTWMCPTCTQPCLYDDIQIESYFLDIVMNPNLPDSCKEIEILADGTWKVCKENEELVDIAADVQKEHVDIISLIDSDEEYSVAVDNTPIHNPKNSKKSGNLKSCLIDLTLSDGEESS